MRLFLIPISTRRTLVYAQRLNKITLAEPSYADKASAKAANVWLQWETGKAGWQRWITDAGNKLFNRIHHEEWSLKSIPPLSARRKDRGADKQKIEVLYPPSVIKEKNVSPILQRLATERNRIHRTRMIWSIVGMPIVAPFAIVPVIPNIPFFYLLYRAFSHWKALSGAKHLEFLLSRNLLAPTPAASLESVYRPIVLEMGSGKKDSGGLAHAEVMLIRKGHAQEIASVTGIPALAVECERAYKQVEEHIKEDLKKKKLE
ncbi:unnamed protein product [Tuber melanosporum]|uniref:(Perigord truffle) hypothetical protein n=1 Tax=Tuber melanosporum (strain Mel28) TaxID=656061 RepID=D5G6M2_TUBMM|nr:uncharacterized protein GSTUM_00002126001 [Tuber melanosporum]CAZ80165.1 unnamed protein product [Tuber melanosporum]